LTQNFFPVPYQPQTKAKLIYTYAAFLFALAVVALLFDPISRQITLYKGAGPYVLDCFLAGSLCIVFGYHASRGKNWAHWAALALAFVMFANNGHQAFKVLRALATDDSQAYRWWECVLLWLRTIVSLYALLPLMIHMRRLPPSSS
jgi:hypothetical protein